LRLIIIRHGESHSNAHPTAVALPEKEGDRLSERGWEQARTVARYLRGLEPAALVSSPMRRARETASAIADELGAEVEVNDLIHELRESDEYLALPPEEQKLRRWSTWMREHGDDADWAPPGGESFNTVLGRVRRWKAELEQGDPDSTVVAVSHGIFLRFFLMDSLLASSFVAHDVHRLWQLRTVNCGVSVFEHGERYHSADPDRDAWVCSLWMARPGGGLDT
jgi:probable phosphoglycerate mutase